MLVLSRNVGQIIKIGDDIEIHILNADRGQIRIGINAPKSVNVVRSELIGRPEKSVKSMPDMVEPERQTLRMPQFTRQKN